MTHFFSFWSEIAKDSHSSPSVRSLFLCFWSGFSEFCCYFSILSTFFLCSLFSAFISISPSFFFHYSIFVHPFFHDKQNAHSLICCSLIVSNTLRLRQNCPTIVAHTIFCAIFIPISVHIENQHYPPPPSATVE